MKLQEKAKRQIDEMANQIHKLEAKTDHAKAEMKEMIQSQLQKMKETKEDIQEKYDELKDASQEKWEESREVFASAADSFQEGFSKISSLVK